MAAILDLPISPKFQGVAKWPKTQITNRRKQKSERKKNGSYLEKCHKFSLKYYCNTVIASIWSKSLRHEYHHFVFLSWTYIWFLDENYEYTATVYTGDIIWAGTDARVFVEIFGEIQSSGEVELEGADNPFERGRWEMLLIKIRPSI